MSMFRAKKLRQLGILGVNQRNADFLLRYNERSLFPFVDDKLKTKKLAAEKGIAVPTLFGVVEIPHQVRNLPKFLEAHPSFVIKPSHGAGGEGILVVNGRVKDNFRKINGMLVSPEDLQHHVFNILSGMYSLGGQYDDALIEDRVEFDPIFDHVSYLGVPDIRIIIFHGVPVMSMIRLPTRLSDGKANLHQGAVGAGIDIARGQTLSGVWRDAFVSEHPDTGHSIVGLQIPHWDELLRLSSRCQELSGLGFQGVDIVLDKTKGPLILELNARPGLSIQIANAAGLLPRLKLVEQSLPELSSIDEKVNFAKMHFGHQEHNHRKASA